MSNGRPARLVLFEPARVSTRTCHPPNPATPWLPRRRRSRWLRSPALSCYSALRGGRECQRRQNPGAGHGSECAGRGPIAHAEPDQGSHVGRRPQEFHDEPREAHMPRGAGGQDRTGQRIAGRIHDRAYGDERQAALSRPRRRCPYSPCRRPRRRYRGRPRPCRRRPFDGPAVGEQCAQGHRVARGNRGTDQFAPMGIGGKPGAVAGYHGSGDTDRSGAQGGVECRLPCPNSPARRLPTRSGCRPPPPPPHNPCRSPQPASRHR